MHIPGFVGEMCTHGVEALVNTTNSTCFMGAAKANESIHNANASCATAMDSWTFMGASLIKLVLNEPLMTACGTATELLGPFPFEVCTKLSQGGEALNSVCTGLSSAAKGPPALAAISSSVHSLATDMKNGVVLHVKTGLQSMQLARAQQTKLLSLDELKQGLTEAMAEVKKAFLEELANAITLVAQEIVTALTKVTYTHVHTQIYAHVDTHVYTHV